MTNDTELKRSLSLTQLILYGLGTTVGAGIYALLGEIAAVAGYLAPWAFLGAGVLAVFTAVSFATLSSRYPRAAGVALYIQQGFHSVHAATIAGLLGVLAGVVSSAALLNGFVGYAQEFIPASGTLIIVTSAVVLCLVACWGISQSVWLAGTITVLEVGGLLWITVLAGDAALGTNVDWSRFTPELTWSGFGLILSGSVLAFYAYIGFEDMIEVAEEVKNVRRNLPIAILVTLGVSTLLYLTLVVAALVATSPEFLAATDAPLADLFREIVGSEPRVIAAIGLLAIINGALIQIIMASRILYGLASRGQLPDFLSYVNARTQTPIVATLAAASVVLVLALSGELAFLAELTSLIILLLFAGVNLSLYRLETAAGSRGILRWLALVGGVISVGMVVRTLSTWF